MAACNVHRDDEHEVTVKSHWGRFDTAPITTLPLRFACAPVFRRWLLPRRGPAVRYGSRRSSWISLFFLAVQRMQQSHSAARYTATRSRPTSYHVVPPSSPLCVCTYTKRSKATFCCWTSRLVPASGHKAPASSCGRPPGRCAREQRRTSPGQQDGPPAGSRTDCETSSQCSVLDACGPSQAASASGRVSRAMRLCSSRAACNSWRPRTFPRLQGSRRYKMARRDAR